MQLVQRNPSPQKPRDPKLILDMKLFTPEPRALDLV